MTFALALAIQACGRSTIPDPRATADAYAAAAERGDSAAIYGLLTSEARRNYGKDGVRRLVADSRRELAEQARALRADGVSVEATAELRYADGEQAVLELESGSFRVSSAGTFPSGARTPAQALDGLRQALARRSYAGLLGVLSNETRGALENDLRSLVSGLEHAETLDVKISGDSAEVELPGGHSVKLKREAGIWRIDDFD